MCVINTHYRLHILVGLLCLLPLVAQGQATKLKDNTITIAFENVPSPPYYFGNAKKPLKDNPGLFVELITQATHKAGLNVTFIRMPWSRILKSLDKGLIQGAFSASYRYDRDRYAQYPHKDGQVDTSRSLTDQTYVLYVSKKKDGLKWDGQKLKFAENRIIGTKNAYSIIDMLEKLGAQIDTAPTTQQNLAKVSVGRIAAYAGLQGMVDPYIENDPKWKSTITKIFPPLKKKPYYLIFNEDYYNKNKMKMEAVWNNIAEIKSSMAFFDLQKKYKLIAARP